MKVVAKGAGSGILNDIPKMVRMTEAVVKAVKNPVTVKPRLGYDHHRKDIVEIAERLQGVGIQAITIHGRTRVTRSSEPADWTRPVTALALLKHPLCGGEGDRRQKGHDNLRIVAHGNLLFGCLTGAL